MIRWVGRRDLCLLSFHFFFSPFFFLSLISSSFISFSSYFLPLFESLGKENGNGREGWNSFLLLSFPFLFFFLFSFILLFWWKNDRQKERKKKVLQSFLGWVSLFHSIYCSLKGMIFLSFSKISWGRKWKGEGKEKECKKEIRKREREGIKK